MTQSKLDGRFRYLLHYVGAGLYSKQQFENESKQYGVNRAFAPSIARQLHFSDRVLLGQYGSKVVGKCMNGKVLRDGHADVFGYYVLQGVNFNGPDELKDALVNQLTVKRIDDSGAGRKVERACGSYECGCTTYVLEDIPEIVEKYQALCDAAGYKGKTFLTGVYRPLPAVVTLDPAPFSRGGVWVDVPNDITKGGHGGEYVGISFLDDYQQRKYEPKKVEKLSAFDTDASLASGA